MSLWATRVEIKSLKDFKNPDEWGQGLGNVYIEEHWHDSVNKKFSILVKSIKKSTDQYDTPISEEYDTWDYDELTRCPRSHLKEINALVWLPKITNRQVMVRVEEQRTTYTYGGWTIGGPMEWRKVRAGYVIYNLYPKPVGYTEAELASLRARGLKVGTTSTINTEIIDSAKDWKSCVRDSHIVEKATANQRARWVDPMEEERVWVEEDSQKIVTWTLKKNYIVPGPPEFTRTEVLKDPLEWSMPMDVLPPKIEARDADGNPSVPLESAKGVRIDIKGGGATWIDVDKWQEEFAQLYPPDKYMVYRRTVEPPPREYPDDPIGMHEAPGSAGEQVLKRPVGSSSVKDYGGGAADPLPGLGSYVEPEDPTPPIPESWTNLGEAVNEAKLDGTVFTELAQSHGTYFDKTVEHGGTYEYYATAVYGPDESPPSNKEVVTYNGPLGIGTGSGGDDDYLGPPLPDVPDDYGETVKYDLPTDDDVGPEIAKRQFLRNGQNEQVTVTMTEPLLTLERGQLVQLPAVQWETWTQSLQISSFVKQETFVLEGFSIGASRAASGALTIDAGSLVLEVP